MHLYPTSRRARLLTGLLVTTTFVASSPTPAGGRARHKKKTKRRYYSTEIRPYTPKKYPDHGLADKLTKRGWHARGFYLTPYWLYKVGAAKTARIMKSAHMNAVVIDVKDDWGQVLWPSKVPLSKKVQRRLIKDPKKTVEIFHEHGIYVIARFVCFKDSKLVYVRPDLAVRFKRPKYKRLFSAGAHWLDQYAAEVKDYIIDLAREWESYGVDEVQLDYIRFPRGRTSTYAHWLHKKPGKRDELIADFLERADRALATPISVDVFGLTTLVDGDPRELGQTIEKMAKYVEAISPMMYANGMTTYFRNQTITERVYRLIECGLWRARKKAPKIALRPFLQAYRNSVPFFGREFIRRQVIAAESAGANGFLFWNSTMKNGTAYRALRSLGHKRLANLGTHPVPAKPPTRWCNPPGKGNVFERTRTSHRRRRRRQRRSASAHGHDSAATRHN